MTYIPDCRVDGNYNERYLNATDKEYLAGFDAAVEALLNLEGNLDVYSADSLVMHYLEENPEKAKELFASMKDWAEMERNELIVSMLDNMDDDEYQKIKAEVDKNKNTDGE